MHPADLEVSALVSDRPVGRRGRRSVADLTELPSASRPSQSACGDRCWRSLPATLSIARPWHTRARLIAARPDVPAPFAARASLGARGGGSRSRLSTVDYPSAGLRAAREMSSSATWSGPGVSAMLCATARAASRVSRSAWSVASASPTAPSARGPISAWPILARGTA